MSQGEAAAGAAPHTGVIIRVMFVVGVRVRASYRARARARVGRRCELSGAAL